MLGAPPASTTSTSRALDTGSRSGETAGPHLKDELTLAQVVPVTDRHPYAFRPRQDGAVSRKQWLIAPSPFRSVATLACLRRPSSVVSCPLPWTPLGRTGPGSLTTERLSFLWPGRHRVGVMESRQLGRTGRQVGVIGLGCWQLGADWGAVSEQDALATLHAAVDAGVNFLDTADVYGDGRSEELVGRLLRERGDAGLAVATKMGRRAEPHVP